MKAASWISTGIAISLSSAAPAFALIHSVTDFKQDFSGKASDTVFLDPGWGDSLLLNAQAYQYRNVLTQNLSDSLFNNGLAAGSATAAATGRFSFKVGYISWAQGHAYSTSMSSDPPIANIVTRTISLSPDTAAVDAQATIIAGQENVPDAPPRWGYLSHTSPPPPSFFNFSAEADKYVAYWGSGSSPGPVRRTTHLDGQGGGSPGAWGTYVPQPPASPAEADGYGKISGALVPNTSGGKSIVAFEGVGTFPAGTLEIRWEDFNAHTSTPIDLARPVLPEDPAVAADSDGNALILWRESANLYAVAYDNARTQIVAPTLLRAGVFTQDSVAHWFRPYAVTSTIRGNFLITYSRAGVVYSRTMALPVGAQSYNFGPEVQITATGDFCMFPDIANTADRVVIGSFKRAPQNGVHRFMGSIFSKTGASFTLTGRTDLDFANENIKFPVGSAWYRWHWMKSASVAMDDKGNVVAAYDNGFNARAALVRNTPIYYDSGVFFSKVFRVANPAIPSFTFDPIVDSVSFDTLRGSDTTGIRLQIAYSTDSTFTAPGSGFQALNAPLFTAAGYYRYRAALFTVKPANLFTPKLKTLDLEYNVKPKLPSVDSIKPGLFPMTAFDPNGKYPLLPRKDSLKLVCSGFDADDGGLDFRLSLGPVPLKTVHGTRTSPGNFTATLVLMPPDTVLNPLPLTLTSIDDHGWVSQSITLLFDYSNIPPTQTLTVFRNRGKDSSGVYKASGGGTDTLSPAPGGLIILQTGDSLTLKAKYTDGNDDNVTGSWLRNGLLLGSKLKSTKDSLVFKFAPDTLKPVVDTLNVRVADPNITVTYKILVRSNKVPNIDSISHTAYRLKDSTLKIGPFDKVKNMASDTGLIIPAGLTTFIQADVSDADSAEGDSVSIKWRVWKPNAGCARGNLACYQKTDSADGNVIVRTFSTSEEYLTVRVTDVSGAFREKKLWLEYPVLDTTGSGAAGYTAAVKTLTGDIDFILGAQTHEKSVSAEITSQGSFPLQILSATTLQNDKRWLDVKLEWLSGTPARPDSIRFGARTDANPITQVKPVIIPPGAKLTFTFRFFSDSLRGDSVLSDTLLVATNDFANPVLRIPFRMVYNDLPVMRLGVPGTKPVNASGYNNAGLPALLPARSNLSLSFSETVKISNPAALIKIYSVKDSAKTPSTPHIIPGDYTYKLKRTGLPKSAAGAATAAAEAVQASSDSLADTLVFTPHYDFTSPFFNVKPRPGFFIYRDILHIAISNGITDKAGNRLDLRLDRKTTTAFDTVFQARIDTGSFRVTVTHPGKNEVGWDPDQSMSIRFNRRLAQHPPKGNDSLTLLDLTALKGDSNRAMEVTSAYRLGKRYDLQFLSLADGDSTLVFKTRPRLPALDSVTVTLSGGIMDTSGLTLDGDGDGFPSYLYTPGDTVDNYVFSFFTRDQDFYVFPNPYRFSDQRHLDKGSITFKNLNSLSGFVPGQEVVLRVHTMTGELLYSSQKLSDAAVGSSRRAWTSLDWDLKNNAGNFVGTGVYVYTLITGQDKVLHKGKVAVIR